MTDDACRVVADGPGAKWKRTAFVVDGSVFFPGAIWFGSDKKALVCAGYDGSKVVQSAGHVYLGADFLAKEYPNDCDLIRSAARRVLASVQVGRTLVITGPWHGSLPSEPTFSTAPVHHIVIG